MVTRRTVEEVYGDDAAVDAAVHQALAESLQPRGPEMLYDMVAALTLPAGSLTVDAGCRSGRHAVELARRFGLRVHGVDPVPRHIEEGRRALEGLAHDEPEVAARVTLDLGVVEDLPEAPGTVDLVWCRDVLVHIPDLEVALRECARVLRRGGHMLVYQMCATPWLEPAEAERLWPPIGVVPENTDPMRLLATCEAAGLQVVEDVELRSEWRERLEEDGSRVTSRQLLEAARLLRAPQRFIEEFGQTTYDVELGNCLWGVYQMIGKLSPHVLLLRR